MSAQDKKIPLAEPIFGPTIQGEGAVIGQQTYFMRFGLCDYKCTMCDSMHAVDPNQVRANAEWLTQTEIIDKFLQEHWIKDSTRWISLSGGNPCIHDLSILVGSLKRLGFKIAVETQGTKAPGWLSMCDVITVSPKGPGMGETTVLETLDSFMQYVMSANPMAVNMKVVVFDQRDLEFASLCYERYGQTGLPFFLSLGNPYPPGLDLIHDNDHRVMKQIPWSQHIAELIGRYKNLFEDIKKDPVLSQVKFLPQWHTFVWGNDKGK
jgi:7-carboxy-7-deazaguanine synthase